MPYSYINLRKTNSHLILNRNNHSIHNSWISVVLFNVIDWVGDGVEVVNMLRRYLQIYCNTPPPIQ